MKALAAYFSAGGVTASLAILAGAIQPVFDCSGFLSMVFYLETGTAPGVFRAINRSAFYYFSAASDGPDLTMKSGK